MNLPQITGLSVCPQRVKLKGIDLFILSLLINMFKLKCSKLCGGGIVENIAYLIILFKK